MKPVAILMGMPRSGTTWVGKILDSHPLADYRHEPDSSSPMQDVPLLPALDDEVAARGVDRFMADLGQMQSLRVCGKQPFFPKQYGMGRHGVALLKTNVLACKLAARAGLRVPLLSALLAGDEDGVLVWKSIESIGRSGLIAKRCPNVRLAMLFRHPCGHVASILRGQSKGKFSADGPQHDPGILRLLVESEEGRDAGLSMDSLSAMTPDEVLAWRWRIFNEHALDQTDGQSNVMGIRYEDVCTDPLTHGRALIEFCGFDWHPQCADFINRSVGDNDASYYAVVKNPEAAANAWRQELAPDVVARIEGVVAGSRAGALYGY